MNLASLPLFERLRDSRRILIAGAGGGFDVFCGLPLFFALREQSKDVFLANLSFTSLPRLSAFTPGATMIEVTERVEGPKYYFPEGLLCQWFAARGESVSVWTLGRYGAKAVAENYRLLVEQLGLDAIVLVDGGTDSLMCGDETGLATPEEDIASLAAVEQASVPTKLLVTTAFGVDAYHGICHAQFLRAVAELIKQGAFLGVFSMQREMPEVQRYIEAVDYVCAAIPDSASIVNTSVASAIEGHFGDHHRSERTHGSTLWINPLMAFYWAFEASAVARRNLYIDLIRETEDWDSLRDAIALFRARLKSVRTWEDIPL